MSAGFAVPLGADMADGQGLAIGAGNRPGRRYGPGAPARGSRWPARLARQWVCGDRVRDTSAVAGLLKRFLVGCAGQRAAARPDPVTEADRVAGVLQVLDDRDRIARPTGPDCRGPVQARDRVGAGSAWPCTAPGEVPSGSRADRQPHRPTRRRHHRDPHRSLRPAHLPGRYPATGRRAARHRPSDHCGTPSRGRSNDMPNVTIFGSARSLWQ